MNHSNSVSENLGTIDRLYILNGGIVTGPDKSIYTPGKFQGQKVSLSCNAYLIQRKGDWILWDTGIDDSIFKEDGGKIIAHGLRGMVVRPIQSQLADLGLSPKDISIVILSHAHFDHVGNASLFKNARWFVQREEHTAMFGQNFEDYGYIPALYKELKNSKIELMDGDLDIFGDGSVQVISTPGHTPGHCSLLVRLAKKGPVLLSADVAHYKYNMVHHAVPQFNSDQDLSVKSMKKVEVILRNENAQLWLNHDIVQTGTIPHSPSFFE